MGRVIGYLRVSTRAQEMDGQRLSILEFARSRGLTVDEFFEHKVSSRKSLMQRGIPNLLAALEPGDHLIVGELSRLGRSVSQIIRLVDELVSGGVRVTLIKRGLELNSAPDMQSKIMLSIFSLLAELERDLISARTKEALAAARSKGVKLGRPRGCFNSKLDGREAEIAFLLGHGVSKSAISRLMAVSRGSLQSFIKNRRIQPSTQPPDLVPGRKALSEMDACGSTGGDR